MFHQSVKTTKLFLHPTFVVYITGQGEFAWEDQGEFLGYKYDDAQLLSHSNKTRTVTNYQHT